jgi:DNA (cytosine-5)-methyltransferase 1|nr:MAG TPA: Cytosine specific methyltransferase [Caudoviricetes sp.]
MKLMSLFDGSGGFPLAASLCGIDPVYASEVEPYPIAVTKSRFPSMKHLGDVSMINGADIEPVDIITFGSPCQDMSVAGKRAGLKHTAVGDDETTRSGLFLEAIRIIKEMRLETNGIYPRFAVWENVPGAFSSNRGEDFRLVLEEFIRISEPNAVMSAVPQAGWAYADCINGDGWSVAYRTFDAQYWGVPQRRRRIYLVADFRGGRAGEILFKREGLRGHTAQSGTQGQEIAGDVGNGIKADDRVGNCLTAYSFDSLSSNSMKSKNPHSGCRVVEIAKTIDTGYPDPSKNQGGIAIVEKIILDDQGGKQINVRSDGKSPTLRAEAHGNVSCVIDLKPLVYDTRGNGDGETVPIITGDHNNRVTDYTALCIEKMPVYCLQGNGIDRADTAGCNGKGWREDKCYTLNTIDRPAVCYGIGNGQVAQTKLNIEEKPIVLDRVFFNQGQNAKYDPQFYTDGICPTLVAKGPAAVQIHYIVRRLTPTECARLQGFPDGWGILDEKEDFTEDEYKFWLNVRNTYAKINGKSEKEYTKAQMLTWYRKLHTDSAEYKMWGNGIALPNALYVMQGIVTEADYR